jgi:hypothetical protein
MSGSGYTGSRKGLMSSGRRNKMELDDFKLKVKPAEIPGQEDKPVNLSGVDGLVEELKAADSKARRSVSRFMNIIFLLLGFYLSRLLIYRGPLFIGYELLVIGFVLILVYFFWKLLLLRKIDYTAPSMTFLKKAERRYTFIPLSEWFLIIPILAILGTGGGFVVHHSFLKYFEHTTIPLLIYIVFFIFVIFFGLWASKKNWKKDQGIIMEKIKKMRREMEMEG